MKSKFTILLISVLLMTSMAVVSDTSTETVSAATHGDFTYELINGDTEVEITGYTGSGTVIIIPGTIEGKVVTPSAILHSGIVPP